MSTDDSISEDVSSSVALSHDHTSANGCKESEASIVSSSDTVSGLAAHDEERPPPTSQTLEAFLQASEGAALTRTSGTPACNISHKIRNLCLHSEEEFSSGRNLPFINPSSLETLRALVREIQSSGETDPEIWKNCEGRWLHLFQLVEKQYQEQILAQQEQYQCQIQLIQDEIKALVQLQNRQSAISQTRLPEGPAPPEKKAPEPSEDVAIESQTSTTSTCPPRLSPNPQESPEDGLLTAQSSGYGTLTVWEPRVQPESNRGKEEEDEQDEEDEQWSQRHQSLPRSPSAEMSPHGHSDAPQTTALIVPSPTADKHRPTSRTLTSWGQRQKQRQRKNKTTHGRSPNTEGGEDGRPGASPKQHMDKVDDPGFTSAYSSSVPLRRCDSFVSEASGLTYWKLDESDLYRPLPDSFESNSFFLMQDASLSQPLVDEGRLSVSLREIYHSKQKGEVRGQEWDSLITSDASSPQVLTLDPSSHVKRSECTSGFTSPSLFSSPSLPAAPSRRCPSASPDSAVLRSHADTDCLSDASSLSGQQGADPALGTHGGHRAISEDEGSHTATATLRPDALAWHEGCQRGRRLEASASLDDPVAMSLLRQNLREKHARHIADLRAYYEAEISALKEKLDLVHLPADLEKSNHILMERCEHLERALMEASARIRELENRNSQLERQLAEWSERYNTAGGMVQTLQEHLKESGQNAREKEAALGRMRNRIRQLEEAAQEASRRADDRDACANEEHKMLQDLLQEYDSLQKDHDGVKDKLVTTENKLSDANEEVSELRRLISKLEAQVKQLEHENMVRARQALHSHLQPSGAGLFHHPDLLLSPSKRQHDEDGSNIKTARDSDGGRVNTRGRLSPPERETVQESATVGKEAARRDVPLAPMMKALIQLEDTRTTEGRALTKSSYAASRSGSRRPTVAFVDSIRESFEERGGAVLRAQRSLSPEGHRSSSLPPRAHRHAPPSTPTKRETLLQPLSAKSSPKRCPAENVSTAFGRPLHCQQHLHNRFDLHFDHWGSSSTSTSQASARARLQFKPNERLEGRHSSSKASTEARSGHSPSSDSSKSEESGDPEFREQDSAGVAQGPDPDAEVSFSYQAQVHSLDDAERLFDELTQEKQQIEAALSRIPGAGARVTMQTRLDEVTLENRLEQVNRNLGSIRMILKRFNILRSSANV